MVLRPQAPEATEDENEDADEDEDEDGDDKEEEVPTLPTSAATSCGANPCGIVLAPLIPMTPLLQDANDAT